jgi:hypothetical protein
MNFINSHIRSVDHFNEVWNNKIQLYKLYFSNNLATNFAYHFKYRGFLSFLYNIDLSEQNNPEIERHKSAYLSLNEVYSKQQSYDSSLANALDGYCSILNIYEKRRKSAPSDVKKENFFNNIYLNISQEDRNKVVLPLGIDSVLSSMFDSFYPSLLSSFIGFLNKNNLLSYNSKLDITYLLEYKVTNNDLAEINSLSNIAKFENILTLSEDKKNIYKLLCDHLSANQSIVDILVKDKEYLESKIIDLYDQIENNKKQGQNGYFLTWH